MGSQEIVALWFITVFISAGFGWFLRGSENASLAAGETLEPYDVNVDLEDLETRIRRGL